MHNNKHTQQIEQSKTTVILGFQYASTSNKYIFPSEMN